MRERIAVLRRRLERMLLWRVWERMLEIEFVDRSVALAGKAFVSFFPLVIVIAAFAPDRIRSSIITTVTARLGIHGEGLTLARREDDHEKGWDSKEQNPRLPATMSHRAVPTPAAWTLAGH